MSLSHSHRPTWQNMIFDSNIGKGAACMALGLVCSSAAMPVKGAEIPMPVARDQQLRVELVAAEPQIVSPIGIAVDKRNRLFVVESHTHHRPAEYKGPETDLVKVFTDTRQSAVLCG